MRTKYGEYPEYHTSMTILISSRQRGKAAAIYLDVLNLIENNKKPMARIKCEPMLSKRKLYPTLSTGKKPESQKLLDMLSYCDGKTDFIDICEKLAIPISSAIETLRILEAEQLVTY